MAMRQPLFLKLGFYLIAFWALFTIKMGNVDSVELNNLDNENEANDGTLGSYEINSDSKANDDAKLNSINSIPIFLTKKRSSY